MTDYTENKSLKQIVFVLVNSNFLFHDANCKYRVGWLKFQTENEIAIL